MIDTNEITDGITSGVEIRQQRGLVIAAKCKIKRTRTNEWAVPAQSEGRKYYVVRIGAESHCTCPDHELRGCCCKHIYAVQYVIEREQNPDGSTTVTETLTATKRTTYPQNWPAYNEAQVNEKDEFQILLRELCKGIEDAPQTNGRPRLPLADAVFAAAFKVYSTVSCRRFMSDLRSAHEKGFISKMVHFNSVFNCLERPEMREALLKLIVASSAPLASIETDFAVDSSGFSTSRFIKWFDHKYGAPRQQHDWVKCHLMCGVKTNTVTAVEILDRNAHDSPRLPSLAATTAENFTMREVSADKGYVGVNNVDAITSLGATPFIACKSNTSARAGGAFAKMFHYFQFRRDEFLSHYHKRSNVESTFSMIKAKFRDHIRSKTDVAMKNEVLCKILCHNICCLISAMYELGIEPMFGAGMPHNKSVACTNTPAN